MPEKRTLFERIANRVFAVPRIAQIWARLKSGKAQGAGDPYDGIPFAPLKKPLSACRFALITTGGIHLDDQPPFDMDNPEGDASFREIPGGVDTDRILITHKYYNHTDADRDLNVVFPLAHFRNLRDRRIIGSIASVHFGFMGHIDGEQLYELIHRTAPRASRKLREDGVDAALLTPA